MQKILIVDDDPNARRALARLLAHELQVVIIQAGNGLEALSALNAEKQSEDSFAVIISDLEMPEMNGAELIRQLEMRSFDLSKFVLMSGNFSYARRVVEASGATFFPKPPDPDEFINHIRHLLTS